MNLLKSTGTIGGLTLVSRILGFGREMLTSRILGASDATDAFVVAFRLPNTFRRLFGEGAFSAGFVPLFSQRLHGEGGEEDARRFSEEVLAVFLPTLILFIECPRLLFPFARQIIAEATRNGGFPPLMLDPIDFAQMFQQKLAEDQARAKVQVS